MISMKISCSSFLPLLITNFIPHSYVPFYFSMPSIPNILQIISTQIILKFYDILLYSQSITSYHSHPT